MTITRTCKYCGVTGPIGITLSGTFWCRACTTVCGNFAVDYCDGLHDLMYRFMHLDKLGFRCIPVEDAISFFCEERARVYSLTASTAASPRFEGPNRDKIAAHYGLTPEALWANIHNKAFRERLFTTAEVAP